MNKAGLQAILISLLFIAGCAPALTPEQFAQGDFGPRPDNYEQIVRDYDSHRYFDPYSVRYEFDYLRKGYLRLGPGRFGWVICGSVNAKNRMGGYVGASPFFVMIKDDKVISFKEDPIVLGLCGAIQDPVAKAEHKARLAENKAIKDPTDPEAKIKKLGSLLEKGMITQEEYDVKRKAIIDQI